MKLCPNCGAPAQDESRFCKNCAHDFSKTQTYAQASGYETRVMASTCPNCGSPVAPAAQFCNNCAAPIPGAGQGYAVGGPVLPRSNRTTIIIAASAGGVVLVGLIIMIILLAGGGSGPSSTIRNIVKAAENNDAATYVKLTAKNNQQRIDFSGGEQRATDQAKDTVNRLYEIFKRKKGVKSVNIKEEKIDKDNPNQATVEWEMKYGDDDTEALMANMTKEEGTWKVVSISNAGRAPRNEPDERD